MTHDQHLTQAAEHLRAAILADKPLPRATLGLRALMYALEPGFSFDPQVVGEMSRLLFAVAPRIADATSGRLTPEHIYTALGCASAAMTCAEAPRRYTLIAYIGVIEAEIRALCLRHVIASGSQLDLALALSRTPVVAAHFHTGPLTAH